MNSWKNSKYTFPEEIFVIFQDEFLLQFKYCNPWKKEESISEEDPGTLDRISGIISKKNSKMMPHSKKLVFFFSISIFFQFFAKTENCLPTWAGIEHTLQDLRNA